MAKTYLSGGADGGQYLADLESKLLGIRANPRRHVKRSARPASLKLAGTSFVYALRGAGMVKFGKADCPFTRLRNLQIGSPYELRFVGYARFNRADVFKAETAIFAISERLGIKRRGEWLEIDDNAAASMLGSAISMAEIAPLEVCGFAVDEDYVAPHDLLRDWSTSGSFNLRPRAKLFS